MKVHDFSSYYWLMAELVDFAKQLGLSARGPKPELMARIERRLHGLPDRADRSKTKAAGPRDSEKRLTRDTRVVAYKSDDKTRAFFVSQIGSDFHFTYRLNQFRLSRKNLTYGDLVDEWLAERDRRRDPHYKPPIAAHGEYNRFIRGFFADKNNEGKSMRAAAKAWNVAKQDRGDRAYKPARKRKHA
jgi:hypothetical protein